MCPYGMFTCFPRIIACIEVKTAVILTHTELIKIQMKIKCVAVRAKKKNFQTACQKQQPHRPFLCSHMPVCAKKQKLSNNHTGHSFALACPYVRGRTCKPKIKKEEKTFKQPHRPFLRSRKRRLDWGIVFIYKCA